MVASNFAAKAEVHGPRIVSYNLCRRPHHGAIFRPRQLEPHQLPLGATPLNKPLLKYLLLTARSKPECLGIIIFRVPNEQLAN